MDGLANCPHALRMDTAAVDQNLRALRTYEVGRRLLFWLPIFFLYFASILPLEQVLLLEAAYYFGTVVLEVPSGWFSDRVGRRLTLLIAMAAQVVGCALFFATSSFWTFLLGQLAFAASAAFVSGTNYAMLYDTLKAGGYEEEMGEESATLVSYGFTALAISSLLGGILAGLELRVAYFFTGLAGIAGFVAALRMVEPPHSREELEHSGVRSSLVRLKDPALRWVFLFSVAMAVLNHVPYEFLQPYVGFLAASVLESEYTPTPGLSGVLFAVMMLLSAWSATRSMALGRRLGHANALLVTMVLQSVIIVAMALFLHPLVLFLIVLRSVPMGLSAPVVNAIVHPRIPSGVRATFLSVQSLAGNLAFSATLLIASLAVAVDQLDVRTMQIVIGVYALGAVACLFRLWPVRDWLEDQKSSNKTIVRTNE